MSRTVKLTLTIASGICVLALAVSCGAFFYRNRAESAPENVVTMAVDWDDVKQSFEEAYKSADAVVCGTVVSKKAYRNYGVVFTDAEVRVEQALSGSAPPQTVHIVYTGGIMDNVEYRCEDELIPNKGERYLFLLSQSDDLKYYPVGGFQGTYALSEENTVTAFNSGNELEKEAVGADVSQIAASTGR